VSSIAETDQFQVSHRYLITAAGLWWRLTEISWARLAEVAGAGQALAAGSVLALLRLFVPLAPSVAGALLFAVSPLQLGYAAHLGDFVKGAFVLAAIPLVVAITLRPMSTRAPVGWSGLAGAVIGIGSGFKFDVAIMAPIATVSLVLFRGRREAGGGRDKLLASGALVLALIVTAWPVFSRQASSRLERRPRLAARLLRLVRHPSRHRAGVHIDRGGASWD